MNEACLIFRATIENEPFARCVAAAFVAGLNPTMDELVEIKTMISEAVANAVIHGYEGRDDGEIFFRMRVDDRILRFEIEDKGCGIVDIAKAKEPLYTTKADLERSGMGMTIMESLSDAFFVESEVGKGTKITIVKRLKDLNRHESDN